MPGRELNLLSLDGGGIRGLSSLQILKQLMENVMVQNQLPSIPKPCDYFDMIGGTSTGGLIAIMLGRLKMDIDSCIEAYTNMSDSIFRKTHHRINAKNGKIQGRFDTQELERAMKQVIIGAGVDENALLMDEAGTPCRVFVCAINKLTSETTLLTSYRRARGGGDRLKVVKIWEACRATSAATSFYDPIQINIGNYSEVFMDGGTGANNPIQHLWNEAKDTWDPEPLDKNLKSIISVGTGIPSVESFKTGFFNQELLDTLVRISTDTQQTAEAFQRTHSELDDSGQYFRFNVSKGLEQIGMEDSFKKNEIMAMTDRYIQSQDVFNKMKTCCRRLAQREANAITLESDATLTLRKAFAMQKRDGLRSMLDLLESISTYDYETAHKRLARKRHSGTCQWFVKKIEFQQWMSHHDFPILWCSGQVGSGKTILTTTVVETLMDRAIKVGNATIYYYNESRPGVATKALDLFASYIKQLLFFLIARSQRWPAGVDYQLHKLYGSSGLQPDLDDLVEVLAELLPVAPNTICIVDGLDEFDDHEFEHVYRTIRKLFRPGLDHGAKMFVTSRKRLDVDTGMLNTRYIAITSDDVLDDIERYVESSIEEKSAYVRQLTTNDHLRNRLKDQLVKGSEGMFLWSSLQLEALWEECFTDMEIEAALQSLPKDLTETYRRCLIRICKRLPSHRHYARKAFLWVACASRALHIDELREAIAFDIEDQSWDPLKIPSASSLILFCANLITVDLTDHHARFVHSSVASFLCQKLTEESLDFQIDPSPGRLICGEQCVNYLSFSNFRLQMQRVPPVSHIQADVPRPMAIARYSLGGIATTLSNIRLRQSAPTAPIIRMAIPMKQRQANHAGVGNFGLLDYARQNWAKDTKSIAPSSRVWEKFKTLALEPNLTWSLHPWHSSGQSLTSHFHGLLGYAVHIGHLPLFDLLLTLDSPHTGKHHLRQYCNLPVNNVEGGLCALHVASRMGHQELVKRLLPYSQVNMQDEFGNSALHYASEKGHLAVVEMLLSIRKVDFNIVNKEGATPAWLAASTGHAELVTLLLKYDAKVWLAPTFWKPSFADIIIKHGYVDVIHVLLAAKETIEHSKAFFEYALAMATQREQWESVILLCRFGVNIEVRTALGETPLMGAAKAGQKGTVSPLLDFGADTQAYDYNGQTALHLAVSHDHRFVVGLLLNRGAKHDARDKVGRTPLHLLNHDDLPIVKHLLNAGADLRAMDDDGFTPQDYALAKGLVGCVEWLRPPKLKPLHELNNDEHYIVMQHHQQGTNLNAKNAQGDTPLHSAVAGGMPNVVAMLIASGCAVNRRNNDNFTALHLLAHDDVAIVKQLHEAGADLDAVDGDGITPLHCAVAKGLNNVVDELIRSGCDVNPKANWRPYGSLQLGPLRRLQAEIWKEVFPGTERMNMCLYDLTPIDIAAIYGSTTMINRLALESVPLNRFLGWKFTPLHFATLCSNTAAVEQLLDLGAGVNFTSPGKFTPLHIAVIKANARITVMLLKAGADLKVSITYKGSSRTALGLAYMKQEDSKLSAILEEEIRRDTHTSSPTSYQTPPERISQVTIQGHVAISKGLIDRSSLHSKAVTGPVDAIKMLLDNGANVDVRDNLGNAPLTYAIICSADGKTVSFLLEQGANPNAQSSIGKTMLYLAVLFDKASAADSLLAKGAYINIEYFTVAMLASPCVENSERWQRMKRMLRLPKDSYAYAPRESDGFEEA